MLVKNHRDYFVLKGPIDYDVRKDSIDNIDKLGKVINHLSGKRWFSPLMKAELITKALSMRKFGIIH